MTSPPSHYVIYRHYTFQLRTQLTAVHSTSPRAAASGRIFPLKMCCNSRAMEPSTHAPSSDRTQLCVHTRFTPNSSLAPSRRVGGGDSFPHKRLLRIYIIQSNNNTLRSPHSSTCAFYKNTAGKGTENLIYVKKEGKKNRK